jgi:mono/diheme cytochrome c family protein
MINIENEIKKKLADLKANPVKIFAWLYPYILIIGGGIGMIYLNNISWVGKNSVKPIFLDTTVYKDLPLIQPAVIPKADVSELSKPSNEFVSKGKTIFSTTCVSCHGSDGKGDGVAAAGLNPKPRNFTNSTGWINGSKLSGIYKTLSEGIPGSAMVAFDTFTPEERFALAQYIRITFVPNPPTDTKEDLTALEQKYKLSQGEQNPGQIPIQDAEVLIIRDGQSRYQKVVFALKQIVNDSNLPAPEGTSGQAGLPAERTGLYVRQAGNNGAEIFNKVVDDKIRALTILTATDEWKKNEQTFVDLIVNELGNDGFNDKIHTLSSTEWDSFYGYMNKLL